MRRDNVNSEDEYRKKEGGGSRYTTRRKVLFTDNAKLHVDEIIEDEIIFSSERINNPL